MELNPKLLACALWCAAAAAPASAADPFASGAAAYRNGDYNRALMFFERARDAGRQSASLSYNLGVTLYKLGRYEAAQAAFETLLRDPEWGEVARLQLGLVAEKRGRPVVAVGYYRDLTNSESAKLRGAAFARLRVLAGHVASATEQVAGVPSAESATEARPGLALVSLSTGYDSNAYALQNELLTDDTVGEDTYTELFAWGQYRLAGTAEDGWRLQGFGFGRRYRDLDSLDLASFNVGISRHIPWNGWQLELGGTAETASLGGERVTSEWRLLGRMQQAFGRGTLTLAYLPSHFSGTGSYRYLDGWRQRFDVRWSLPLGILDIDTLYRLDLDDREDLDVEGGGFYSYSPRRQTFGLELEWPLASGWALTAGSHYRLSDYRGANRLQDSDGQWKVRARDGDRLRSWVGAEVQLLPRLQLDARVIRTDNDENFDIYTYDKTEASLSVRYLF